MNDPSMTCFNCSAEICFEVTDTLPKGKCWMLTRLNKKGIAGIWACEQCLKKHGKQELNRRKKVSFRRDVW